MWTLNELKKSLRTKAINKNDEKYLYKNRGDYIEIIDRKIKIYRENHFWKLKIECDNRDNLIAFINEFNKEHFNFII